MEEVVAVGRIYGTFGVKGNLKFELFLDIKLPEDIYIKTKDRLLKVKIQTIDRKKSLIKFYEYDDIEKAKELRNSLIYIPKNLLPKLQEDEYFVFELVDSQVYIDDKIIGIVKDIDDRLIQAHLIIKCSDGKERYLPFLNQFIDKVDRENRKIYIKPPEGWFEI